MHKDIAQRCNFKRFLQKIVQFKATHCAYNNLKFVAF